MADMGLREAVAEELSRASDIGETRSRAQLQASIAIGAGDLEAVLNELREAGEASEVAPGEWEPVMVVDVPPGAPEPEPERGVEVDEFEEHEPGMVPADGRLVHRHGVPGRVGYSGVPERAVLLSRAMVESLDAEALGKLVLAGVQGEEGVFVLRVEP